MLNKSISALSVSVLIGLLVFVLICWGVAVMSPQSPVMLDLSALGGVAIDIGARLATVMALPYCAVLVLTGHAGSFADALQDAAYDRVAWVLIAAFWIVVANRVRRYL